MIGNIKCYWYNKEGLPRITIGPTWMFAIPILIAMTIMLYCFGMGLYYMDNMPLIFKFVSFFLIALNLFTYFKTLFDNPGIPKELFVKEVM